MHPGRVVVIVYAALPTAELLNPLNTPIAFTVCDVETVIGPVYNVEDGVGVDPFVV